MSTFRPQKHVPILVQDALTALGRRMTGRRKAERMTQPELALLAGVGLSTVVSIEKGYDGVSVGNLCKVLDALGVLDQLDGVARLTDMSP